MHVLAQEGGAIDAVFGSFENTMLWMLVAVSFVALAFAYYLVREVLTAPEGTDKMKEIATAIQEGAKAYLSRQFRTVGIFIGLLTVVLFFILPAPDTAALASSPFASTSACSANIIRELWLSMW